MVPEVMLYVADEAVPIWRRTEEELGAMGLPPPYWAFAWAGGQALARYVLDHPAAVAGRRVLDLAAGSGLVAIAAAMAGAAPVIAADIDAFTGRRSRSTRRRTTSTSRSSPRTCSIAGAARRATIRPGRRPVLRARHCGPRTGVPGPSRHARHARAGRRPGRTYLPKERLAHSPGIGSR